jgi:hypothetical protein
MTIASQDIVPHGDITHAARHLRADRNPAGEVEEIMLDRHVGRRRSERATTGAHARFESYAVVSYLNVIAGDVSVAGGVQVDSIRLAHGDASDDPAVGHGNVVAAVEVDGPESTVLHGYVGDTQRGRIAELD